MPKEECWNTFPPFFFLVLKIMLNKVWFKSFLLLTLLCGSFSVFAQSGPYRIPWENNNVPCWEAAGTYQGIDPWLLYAMASVESSHNPAAINRANSNGTYDVGMMQINSIHFPMLRKYGIKETELMNGCVSTYVGAWILAEKIRKYGYTWEAIAAYNVGSLTTPGRINTGKKYATKVMTAYQKLVARNQVASVR